MVYDSDSDDEIFDAQKIDGVAKDVKIDEPKVVKQVIRDRCILTKPDEVEQPTISPILSKSGLISAGDIKNVSKVENKSISDFIKHKCYIVLTKNKEKNSLILKKVTSAVVHGQPRVVKILQIPNVGKPTSDNVMKQSVKENLPKQHVTKPSGFKKEMTQHVHDRFVGYKPEFV
ncbi:hypothetical protein L1987_15104 [Smallanthus sonchifolius]|uniref:Uncharacterized protein n=1 Tax=Smallanthus sonchifolius TaxID=185202 RepID=A0ACB9J515_9ASTR|nr:hypothetical protein L1987_15104 [Smallanthus sonchifolius]